MSTEPFVGEVKLFGFYFAPRGYMNCQGQILAISQNTALFALLGTVYGGNGQTTFGLPDLQGRVPIGQGQGGGLPDYPMGEQAGAVSYGMKVDNLPAHVHPATGISAGMPVSTAGPEQSSPAGGFLANPGTDKYAPGATAGAYYPPLTVAGNTAITGSGYPMDIMNPYLVLNYSIAIEGIFPSRN